MFLVCPSVYPSVPFSWTQYLRNALSEFLWISINSARMSTWTQGWMDYIFMVKCYGHCNPRSIPFFHECDILLTPWGNIFKCGINFHLNSRINWLDFGGQRSMSLWPHVCPILVETISQERLEGIWHKHPLGNSFMTYSGHFCITIWPNPSFFPKRFFTSINLSVLQFLPWCQEWRNSILICSETDTVYRCASWALSVCCAC